MVCSLMECCQFFNDNMKEMPNAADFVKNKLCRGDYKACNRFKIYKEFGANKVPPYLNPDDAEQVKKILKCLRKKQESKALPIKTECSRASGSLSESKVTAPEIKITFPGGEKVNAEINSRIIPTDQPVESGGSGTAPSPFDYFLASLGTCAGIYVLSFCQQRKISTEGLALTQRMEYSTADDGKKKLDKIAMEITLPHGFPDKYRNAIVKTAELCAVKKVIMDPPEFEITTRNITPDVVS